LHSSKIWLASVALAFSLAASVGGGCAVFDGGTGGNGGSTSVSSSSGSTSTTSSTVSSSSSGTGGTGGIGTGGTGGTGGTCACTTAANCPTSTTVCASASCTSCACAVVNAAAGTACTDSGGTTCNGSGSCVQCNTAKDCTSTATPLCIASKCVAPTCTDGLKDGIETDIDCGGGGPMNCPACGLGKACSVNADCASAVCTAKVCTAPPANNTCATAEMHTLTPTSGTLTINATTAGSTENYTSFCGDTTTPPSSPNVVYAITLSAPGDLDVVLTAPSGSALVPALDIRTDCTKADYCLSTGAATDTFTTDVAAGTYYVIVTGQSGTSGAFTLSATLTAATCGNGVVDPGEQCDPGMSPPANDGCGAPGTVGQCQFVAPRAGTGASCTDPQILQVPAGKTSLLASAGMSTYGYSDHNVGSCSQLTGGIERVFQMTPTITGTLSVSVGYEADDVTSTCAVSPTVPECWAHMLYSRTTCATATTEIACVESHSAPNVPSTLSFAVTAGTPYWIFVDGFNGASYSYGPFNLFVNLQ